MKDNRKDVIMICKGHYNQETYKTTLSALKAYQSREYGIEEQYISHDDTLECILFPVAEEYFQQKHWMQLLRDRVWKQGVIFASMKHKETTLDGEYVCNLLISQICNLQVLEHGTKKIIIDITDYAEGVNII